MHLFELCIYYKRYKDIIVNYLNSSVYTPITPQKICGSGAPVSGDKMVKTPATRIPTWIRLEVYQL
jgi:hypothetical protein